MCKFCALLLFKPLTMHKFTLSLLLALTLPSFVFAQADIKFTTTTHNYGTVTQGANATCRLDFVNSGTLPLTITTCQSNCACIVANFPPVPILPKQHAVITVKYNTVITGPINYTITVYSNAKSGNAVLTFKGNVKAPPAPQPPQPPTK